MRGGRKGNEELGAVSVGALVGHAHNAPCVVSQRRTNLIFEQLVGRIIDGSRGLGFGVGGGTARLDHEVGNQTVEGAAVVEARGAESQEVFGRLGHRLAKDFDLDIAARGVQLCSVSIGVGVGE